MGKSLNESKMPYSGGRFTGPISFQASSLPGKSLQFICGIDAFADGGQMGWQSASEVSVGYASSAGALSAEIANDKLPARLRVNTSPTAASPDTFKQNGFYYTSDSGISNVSDANILTIAHTSGGWAHQLGFKFNGTGVSGASYDGADVYTRLYSNSTGKWTNWHTLLSSGNYTAYTVTKTGSGASGTWGINISGNAATATKINVRSSSYTSSAAGEIWIVA